MNFCPNCGSEVKDGVNFCRQCGYCLKDVNKQPKDVDTQPAPAEADNKKSKPKKKNKNRLAILLFVFLFLVICFGYNDDDTTTESSSSGNSSKLKQQINQTSKQQTSKKSDFSKYLVYEYAPHGIYAFKIPKSNFDKDKFVEFAQTLPRSQSGDTSMVFVFDNDLHPRTKEVVSYLVSMERYNMPMYTADLFWKQYPYFYFTDMFDIKQSYCEISGLKQEYYERNKSLLYDENKFTNKYTLTAPGSFGLSSLNGCNPDYTYDSYTIQMEADVSTFSLSMLSSSK